MQIDLYFWSMDDHMVQAQCSFQSLWDDRKGDHCCFCLFVDFFFSWRWKEYLHKQWMPPKKGSSIFFSEARVLLQNRIKTLLADFADSPDQIILLHLTLQWLFQAQTSGTDSHSFLPTILLFSLTLQSYEETNTAVNVYKVYPPSTYFKPRVLVCRISRHRVREINTRL